MIPLSLNRRTAVPAQGRITRETQMSTLDAMTTAECKARIRDLEARIFKLVRIIEDKPRIERLIDATNEKAMYEREIKQLMKVMEKNK